MWLERFIMFDKEILRGLVGYNKYKKFCFDNYIPIEYNDFYEMKLKARYNKSSRIKKRISDPETGCGKKN